MGILAVVPAHRQDAACRSVQLPHGIIECFMECCCFRPGEAKLSYPCDSHPCDSDRLLEGGRRIEYGLEYCTFCMIPFAAAAAAICSSLVSSLLE